MPGSDDRTKVAISDDEIFTEAADFYDLCQTAESENRKDGIEALKFIDGDQWPTDIFNTRTVIEQRPCLTINTTAVFRNRIVNNLKQQRPRIKVHPVGDGADVDMAEKVNGLIRHIENYSNAGVSYDIGVQSAVDIGWGYWRVITEYVPGSFDDQELKIVPVYNTFTVYFDPSAKDPAGRDAGKVIITETMSRTDYKRMYPGRDAADFRGMANGDSGGWVDEYEIRLAEYFRIRKVRERLYRMADGTGKWESDFARGTFQPSIGPDGKPISRMADKPYVEWFKINGTTIVDKRSYEGKNPLPGRFIPVVRCQGNVSYINGEACRYGVVKNYMDPARMFNYWRTAETEIVALAPKAPWVGAEGQFDGHPEWDDANVKSYSRLVYKPVVGAAGEPIPPPQRTQPGQIPAGIVNAAEGAKNDLMMVAGMPHEPGQDSRGEVVSGQAIKRREAMSDMTHYQFFDNQTMSISFTGEILLDLIPHYYDTPRMQRIVGSDGMPAMTPINQPDPVLMQIKNDMTIGRYDIVMDTGPGFQTKREESTQSIMGLLDTPLGEVIVKTRPDIAVRNMDFNGAEDLADSLAATTPQGTQKAMEQLPKAAQAIVATLQQQLQQATQHIQALEADAKHGLSKALHDNATRMNIARMADETKRHDIQTEAQVKIEDTHTRAHTDIAVAEIQQAGKLMDTHAEAEHEKAAAKELVKAGTKAIKSN